MKYVHREREIVNHRAISPNLREVWKSQQFDPSVSGTFSLYE
jgi:hypothetical protein